MNQTLEQTVKTYRSLGIQEQLDYDKFYLYSIITHSTAIEGSTVTETENRLLFDEGLGAQKPIEELLMNLDLKAAYEEGFRMAKRHEPITPPLLCALSALVMKRTGSVYNTIAGSFSSANGDLRLVNVSAGRGGKSYIAWQKVPARLEDFCTWLNAGRNALDTADLQAVYTLSFLSHYRLVEIHPWADGNGRMARLLMNMLQHEAGAIPSIVLKENRAEYIKSLAESQESGDTAPFLNFMMNHHLENLGRHIAEYKASLEK